MLVLKADAMWRFCMDFQKVASLTKSPLPTQGILEGAIE